MNQGGEGSFFEIHFWKYWFSWCLPEAIWSKISIWNNAKFACGAKTVNYYNFCTFSEYFLLCLRPSALKTEEKEEKRENKKIERKEKKVFINTWCWKIRLHRALAFYRSRIRRGSAADPPRICRGFAADLPRIRRGSAADLPRIRRGSAADLPRISRGSAQIHSFSVT